MRTDVELTCAGDDTDCKEEGITGQEEADQQTVSANTIANRVAYRATPSSLWITTR